LFADHARIREWALVTKANSAIGRNARFNDFIQPTKAPPQIKNIGGIDLYKLLMWVFATTLRRHISQGALKSFSAMLVAHLTADITGNTSVSEFARNLIDFIYINNASFSFFNIIIRGLIQAQLKYFLHLHRHSQLR